MNPGLPSGDERLRVGTTTRHSEDGTLVLPRVFHRSIPVSQCFTGSGCRREGVMINHCSTTARDKRHARGN